LVSLGRVARCDWAAKDKTTEFPLPPMLEQRNLGSCWWLVVPSVGCFPCREEKRRVGGSGKKTRQPESDELKSRAKKKNLSSSGLLDDPVCALVKCRVVLCICLRVWVRVGVWSRTLDGPQAASFEVPELGKRDPALGTQGRKPKPNRVVRLCQVVGSAMRCFFGNGSWWGVQGDQSRGGCDRDEALRLMFSVVWLALCPGCHVSTSAAHRMDGREGTSGMLFAATGREGISAGAYEPARGRGCGRRF
jgi:hypothetical protein